ncbi:hypothetical protein [Sphingomonas aliaeris]|uniref:hypothetical protein n=1 Tax=Sphingomonas aliaeris TaxID=2759526 RepID=UPI001CEDBAE2|nr:hypothetical protein [Sphingomonas aliaeris]
MTLRWVAPVALLAGSAAFAQTPPAPARTAQPVATKVTYIHAGTLLDKPGQKPRGNSTIIVRDGTIAEIRDGFAPPNPARPWSICLGSSSCRA